MLIISQRQESIANVVFSECGLRQKTVAEKGLMQIDKGSLFAHHRYRGDSCCKLCRAKGLADLAGRFILQRIFSHADNADIFITQILKSKV